MLIRGEFSNSCPLAEIRNSVTILRITNHAKIVFSHVESDRSVTVNAEKVRINLRYDRANLDRLWGHAKAHGIERNGRYETRQSSYLRIWTHNWGNRACKEESSLMFSLEFDWNTASLMSVALQPGFDWEIFLDELARLERAALGDVVYGKYRCEPPRSQPSSR